MTAPSTTPPAEPIADPSVAIDCLLAARWDLLHVQESTVAGTALWECMGRAMAEIDGAIVDLRKAGTA